AGLSIARRQVRSHLLHRHVRARRTAQLPHVLRARSPTARGRRPILAAHDRQQYVGTSERSLDRALHLSELAPAFDQADRGSRRAAFRRRGLARIRPVLRSHADVLVRAVSRQLAGARVEVRRAVSSDVGVLVAVFGRGVPLAPHPALADPAVAARGGWGVGRGEVSKGLGLGKKRRLFNRPLTTWAQVGAIEMNPDLLGRRSAGSRNIAQSNYTVARFATIDVLAQAPGPEPHAPNPPRAS